MSIFVRIVVGVGLVFSILNSTSAELATASKKAGAAGKSGKKAKKSNTSAQEAAGTALLDKSDGVQDCAGKFALNKGSNRVEVETKVTINSSGQVVNIATTVTLDKGDSAPVKECVDQLIKSIRFPIIQAPLTTIERTWTIANS